MAYAIQKKEGYTEVRVSGKTSMFEVLKIMGQLFLMDPGKKRPDLWVVAKESQVPFQQFGDIAAMIKAAMPTKSAGSRSAIVAADELHKAQLEMYRAEASIFPYEFQVFLSHAEAESWIKEKPPPLPSTGEVAS